MDAVLLQQDGRVEDEFGLGGERADDLDDAVEFDLLLGLADVVLLDGVGPVALGEFARRPEEVERAPGVAVFLGGEGRTERDDVVVERVGLEGDLRAVLEGVTFSKRTVYRKLDRLESEGYLERILDGKGYYRATEAGRQYVAEADERTR